MWGRVCMFRRNRAVRCCSRVQQLFGGFEATPNKNYFDGLGERTRVRIPDRSW